MARSPNVKIFLCSAREDESLRKKLEKQLQTLQRYGLIDALWHSESIIAGTETAQEIGKHLSTAQVILLLITHGSVIFREVLEIQHRSWSYKPDEKSNRDKMRCCKADKGVRCR